MADIIEARRSILLNEPHIAIASGDVVTFSTDMVAPLKEAIVTILPQQTGTGTPSPDNVMPLVGMTEVYVPYYQHNMFDPNVETSKGNFTADGEIGSASNTYVFGIPCKRNSQYTLYSSGGGASYRVGLTKEYPKGGVYVDYLSTRTTSSGAYVINTGDYNFIALASTNIPAIAKNMIIAGNDTTQEKVPFKGRTVHLDWSSEAGIVYGCEIGLMTGKLKKTHANWTYDETKAWEYSSSWSKTNTAVFYVTGQSNVYYPSYNYLSYTTCDRFPCMTRNELYNTDTEGISPSGGGTASFTLRINKSRASNTTDLKTWLESNPINVTYKLKASLETTYQLDPVTLKTLRGINNIYTSFGGTSVKYWKH